MFTAKSLIAMCAIAAGGFLNAAGGVPGKAGSAVSSQRPIGQLRVAGVGPAADSQLQQASAKALLAEIRADLQDKDAGLRLSELRFERASGRTLMGTGQGVVLLDAVTAIPISVSISYDLPETKVEHVEYRVTGGSRTAELGLQQNKLKASIADLIGSRLVLEFAQQPVDFSLVEISHIDSGRNRMLVSGNGITRFPGEGAAFTRFVAIVDKFTSRVLHVDYELLQEVDVPSDTSLALLN